MQPVLLVRSQYLSRYERQFAVQHFSLRESRVHCADSFVVGRYSVLPFYEELEVDLAHLGSRLVNSCLQHRWVSSFAYYDTVEEFTPRSWSEEAFLHCRHPGPFVVKGRMSSKKWKWKSQMFAANKHAAIRLAERLKEDGEIREQGVVFREYIPLKQLEEGPHGLPITNEWRFFYLGTQRLSYGYYWGIGDSLAKATISPAAVELADAIASRVAEHTNFFVLDLAETAEGRWILIEINDGQTATPGEHDLDELYRNLSRAIHAYL